LVGFLLSPLLVLSRHTSRIPAHRIKRPHERLLSKPTEREAQRRALAVSFYLFSLLIVFVLIGFWTQWSLGGRNPWVWIVLWLAEGRTSWSRPVMLLYWALIGSFSVGAWSRQLVRSRKFQNMNSAGILVEPVFSTDTTVAPSSPTSGSGFSHVATDLLDAADKRVPTLSLNARRKSFHALALFMFLPGIILDVSSLKQLYVIDLPHLE
jgi:dolichol kinase